MNNEDQLFTVSCVSCSKHSFKFSKNLLEEYGFVALQCPECAEETQVEYNGLNGVTLKKGKR